MSFSPVSREVKRGAQGGNPRAGTEERLWGILLTGLLSVACSAFHYNPRSLPRDGTVHHELGLPTPSNSNNNNNNNKNTRLNKLAYKPI